MNKGHELSRLRQAIIDNTQGDLFWIGEILLAELEKETGFGRLENALANAVPSSA